MRSTLIALLLVSIPLGPAQAGDDVHIVSADTGKERVLLLLEGELIAIGKWPLQVQLFETSGLSECQLQHSAIVDLKKIRIKTNDDPQLPFLLLCGNQMVSGRRVEAVTMAPAGQVAPESQTWRVERDASTATIHWRESDENQWTITYRRPADSP